jgi:hypothetical protein
MKQMVNKISCSLAWLLLLIIIFAFVIEETKSTNFSSKYRAAPQKDLTGKDISKKEETKKVQNVSKTSSLAGVDEPKVVQIDHNNIYSKTIDFFTGMFGKLDSKVSKAELRKKMLICKLNIFNNLRRSLINCKVLNSQLKEKPLKKGLCLGCVSMLLNDMDGGCKASRSVPAYKILQKAAKKVSQPSPKCIEKLKTLSYAFIKKLVILMRIRKAEIQEKKKQVSNEIKKDDKAPTEKKKDEKKEINKADKKDEKKEIKKEEKTKDKDSNLPRNTIEDDKNVELAGLNKSKVYTISNHFAKIIKAINSHCPDESPIIIGSVLKKANK